MELDEIESRKMFIYHAAFPLCLLVLFKISRLCPDLYHQHQQKDTLVDNVKEIIETWIILDQDLDPPVLLQEEDEEKIVMIDMKIVEDAEMIAAIVIDALDPVALHHLEETEEVLIGEVNPNFLAARLSSN